MGGAGGGGVVFVGATCGGFWSCSVTCMLLHSRVSVAIQAQVSAAPRVSGCIQLRRGAQALHMKVVLVQVARQQMSSQSVLSLSPDTLGFPHMGQSGDVVPEMLC